MRTTTEGLALIQEFEDCALTAFWDPRGECWTIAWGRTRGVRQGDTCTQGQAAAWFLEDVAEAEALMLGCVEKVTLSDNQVSALVSFCYNVGFGLKGVKSGFRELKSGAPSTLLQRLRAQDFSGAAAEFPRWKKAGGVVVPGVLRRRLAEQALFLKAG